MQKKLRLSKTQLEVLRKLDVSTNYAFYMPAMGNFQETPYWFLKLDMAHVRYTTMDRLIELELVKVYDKDRARISDKGRQVLRGIERSTEEKS